MILRYIFVMYLAIQCVTVCAQNETSGDNVPVPVPMAGSAESGSSSANTHGQVATDAITDEDLNDCKVLRGKRKDKEFQQYLENEKRSGNNGDLDSDILVASIMDVRFRCYEKEILGEGYFAWTFEDADGTIFQETPRKTISNIQTHPNAFMALKDAVEANARIADQDLGVHIMLGQYYSDYHEALGNSQTGYLSLAGAYEAQCHQALINDDDKKKCRMLELYKLRYKKMISQEMRNRLDQKARDWAKEYELDHNAEAKAAADEAADMEASDDEYEDVNGSVKLRGKDFEMSAWGSSKVDGYKNILIGIKKVSEPSGNVGEKLTTYTGLDGSKDELDVITFSPGDSFELKNLIPGAPREQLVVSGKTQLGQGNGSVNRYSIYRVDKTGITELLSLITGREFDGTRGRPHLRLTATVQEEAKNGELVIAYRYKIDDQNSRTIDFRWDGSAFVDTSGTYKKIHEKYRP